MVHHTVGKQSKAPDIALVWVGGCMLSACMMCIPSAVKLGLRINIGLVTKTLTAEGILE